MKFSLNLPWGGAKVKTACRACSVFSPPSVPNKTSNFSYVILPHMNKQPKQQKQIDYKRNDKSKTEIELEVTIPQKDFQKAYKAELDELAKTVRIKGFRPGKAPKDMVEASHGKEATEKAIDKLVPEYTVAALRKEELIPAIPVTYDIVSADPKKGLNFKAKITIVPEVKLPDLKKVRKGVKMEPDEATDKEVETFLKQAWEQHKGKHKNKDDKWAAEVAKKLGFKSQTMKEWKKEIKDAISKQKKNIVRQKYTKDLLSKAIEMSGIEIPDSAREYEAAQREKSFEEQLKQMNVSPEQFCQIRGTSMEELREQWKKDSKDAWENDVFLAAYAKDRKIEVTPEELKAEIDYVKKNSKDQDQKVDDKVFEDVQWQEYIRRVVLKRKSFKEFLEEVDSETFKQSAETSNSGNPEPSKARKTKKQSKSSKK